MRPATPLARPAARRAGTTSAVALAVALLLVGCGGTLVSPGTGATPGAGLSVQDQAALRSSVHAYFSALSRFDYVALSNHSAGKLHQLWTWSKEEWGTCTCPSSHILIKSLVVEWPSAGRIEMGFSAVSARGEFFSGPLLAVKVGGTWRVTDYQQDGRDAERAVVTGLRTSQTKGGIQIKVVGLWMPLGSGDLWMVVSNHSGAPVRAVDYSVSGPHGTTSSPQGLSPNTREIDPGANVMTDMGWAPRSPIRPGQRYVAHPVFVNLGTGERESFDLVIRIPRKG
jgi:hypothetical protein